MVMKYYLGQIEEQQGEYEHTTTIKFCTDEDPSDYLEKIVKTWYGEVVTDDYGDHWVNGEIIVSSGHYSEITKHMFKNLPYFINEIYLLLGVSFNSWKSDYCSETCKKVYENDHNTPFKEP